MSNWGGGGFMQQDGPGGSQSPGAGKSRDKSTIRPVTIRQLLDADQPHPDADFTIDNSEVNHVSFVAKVLNITRGTTNISYTVEDGTGSIDVRSWIDSQEDDTGMGDGIAQDTLVRVLGGIKLFSGKRFINALHVHPVVDMNEQQFHLLEAIHCHLLNTRGPPVRDLPYEQVSVCSGPAIVHRQTLEVMHRNAYNLQTMVLQIMLNPMDDCSTNHNQTDQWSDLTDPIQRKIMGYFTRLGPTDSLPPEGIDVSAIARGTNVSEDQIRDEVENLIGNGHLYSTSDDSHLLPTS